VAADCGSFCGCRSRWPSCRGRLVGERGDLKIGWVISPTVEWMRCWVGPRATSGLVDGQGRFDTDSDALVGLRGHRIVAAIREFEGLFPFVERAIAGTDFRGRL
jgi:hypothetical protein